MAAPLPSGVNTTAHREYAHVRGRYTGLVGGAGGSVPVTPRRRDTPHEREQVRCPLHVASYVPLHTSHVRPASGPRFGDTRPARDTRPRGRLFSALRQSRHLRFSGAVDVTPTCIVRPHPVHCPTRQASHLFCRPAGVNRAPQTMHSR